MSLDRKDGKSECVTITAVVSAEPEISSGLLHTESGASVASPDISGSLQTEWKDAVSESEAESEAESDKSGGSETEMESSGAERTADTRA
jgi:hypothetical protein|eukprot:CAMPEP_0174320004 /NCGR_PEP_ID=MMETSP0810-20121108/9254_1 /TAXON_ID=73025 ORGANISM="Eutreptiella gymnastica-like, Strain CCMP1594" /NCGR_SAMPLE_ID=MMETSP0810 /ASSEMBLY_ACC=CAM_ASM_000659 /LENGTH=89 /DNA_ID=CAMNT_0015430759 /DNA_START=1446 /DNA_END=1715 /DNA_ORIENTATION=-